MKIYGELEKAQLENTTADTASLPAGMMTYRTDESIPKVSNGTVMKELVDTDKVQTLQNKIHSDPEINGATTYDQIATPSNPAASEHKIYFKSDGKAYTLDSSGSEQPLGSGSGSGGINYVPDGSSNIESTIGDWEDDDGAGSPSSSLSAAVTTTVGEVLIDSASLKFSKTAANASGHFFKLDTKTIDPAVRGKRLYFSFYWKPISGYVNDDLVFEAYDITNAAVLYSGTAEDIKLLNLTGKNLFFADLEDTTAQVELRLKVNNTNTNAFTASADLFEFKVDTPIPGLKESTYSASFTNNGTAAIDRDDNNIIASINRSSTGSGTVTFTGGKFTVAPIVVGNLQVGADGSTMRKLHIFNVSTSGFSWISNEDLSDTRSYYDADFEILVKAQGADAKQVIVSTTENLFRNTLVRYKTDTAMAFTAGASKIVDFEDVDYDDLNTVTTGAAWKFTAPESGKYKISARVVTSVIAWTAGDSINLAIRKNGTNFIQLDADVIAASGTCRKAPGGTTTMELAKGDYIDVTVASARAGTLLADSTHNWIAIESIKDTSAFSVYGETESLDVYPTVTQTTVSADTWIDAESSPTLLPLGQGTWEIGYDVSLTNNWVSGSFYMIGNVGIFDSSNNQLAGTVGMVANTLNSTSIGFVGAVSRSLILTISEPTSYKLRIRASSSSASATTRISVPGETGSLTNPDSEPHLYARRIK